MANAIDQITILGFKSIRKLEDFKLGPLNVLIGANGAGKSNFVEVFRLLRAIAGGTCDAYVAKNGGGDGLFFNGPKATPGIRVDFRYGRVVCVCLLEPTADNRVVTTTDKIDLDKVLLEPTGDNRLVTTVIKDKLDNGWPDAALRWTVYHFHDTSALASVRREQAIEDTDYLRADASNIAAFLREMREKSPVEHGMIRDVTRVVAPFFDDFLLKERGNGIKKTVALDWRQKGSDFPFQAWHLSDGTLRFICLATALLQPTPPDTIVIDEPELGLHPHALEVLAGLLRKASTRAQIIVSTQSAPLLNHFEPEEIIVVNRRDGASEFSRLDRAKLAAWLEDYTLGELWQKNYIDGGPGND